MSKPTEPHLAAEGLKLAASTAAAAMDTALETVVGPFVGATFTVFEALAARNDEALAEARLSAVEDEVIKLRDEMRKLESDLRQQGRVPDRQDPLSQAAVASEFVRGVTEASTVQKREALVVAACAQFDPRRGAPAVRDYWLRRVRDLPEIHLAVVLLVADGPWGIFNGRAVRPPATSVGGQLDESSLSVVTADEADVIAYQDAALELANARGLLQQPQAGDLSRTFQVRLQGGTSFLRTYTLTASGKMLVSYCRDS